jgi:DNA-binding SARP family transcriptional activator/tetratricopeptide (TPR) repeat protein
MRFRILGPLSVTVDGAPLTASRERIVVSLLLLNPGRVVSAAALIEAVWGDDPPATARGQLQHCISRLRRVLPPGAIASDPAGYRIDPGSDDLDAVVFARLAASKDATLLRRGLDLWRGDALSGIESEAVRRAAATLDQQRALAFEDWAELELAAGHERDLIGPLTDFAERFPLRERLRAQLIRALTAAGRTGDALAEFRRLSDALDAELGIEPGPALQELHRQILGGGRASARPADREVVRALPRTVADFTGRGELIARLMRRAAEGGPVVLALDGMAGSGKTTLALHVAARLGEQFPDAHLYVDLHGHSDREPLEPSAALLLLLRQLGIGADRAPADRSGRVDLWRDELAGRRALVVLDNAASSDQVVDLLPASPEVLVLLTSRRRLLGLDGVHPESLPVLDETEAVTLLARIAGDRVRAETEAAADLIRRCGGLPLAIRLAGTRLAHRPRWQVADLVKRFGAAVLPELTAESRSVAGALAISYDQLPAAARRAFRLLGVHPGRLFDAVALAALAELPVGEARDLLDDLVDVHLIEEPEPDVFRMHDLLHEYASALAAELPGDERRAALRRLLDLELGAVLLILDAARRRSIVRDLGLTELPAVELTAAMTEPRVRFDRSHRYFYALAGAAVEGGYSEYSWQLARAAWWPLFSSGYVDEIRELFTLARAEAHRVGNAAAQATCANYLASIYFRRARFDDAMTLLQEAIRLRRGLGDPTALSSSLGNLGAIYASTSRYVEGEAALREALELAERAGDDHAVMLRLDGRAVILSKLGFHEEALHLQRRRMFRAFQTRDEMNTVHSLATMIIFRRRAGRMAPLPAERALRIMRRHAIRARFPELAAEVQAELGDVLRELGRHAEAITQMEQALEMFDEANELRLRSRTLNMLAVVWREAGDPETAADLHRQARELATSLSQPFEVALAHLGLGDCATDPSVAREHWRIAEEILTRLRMPERFEAAARL